MFLYCGVGINSIDCLLPCSSGDDCPLDHECYATQECSDSFYCGESFSMANTTCLSACPDGRDDSCPVDMQCYAQTSCGNVPSTPSKNTVDVGSSYCGRNFTDAASSCHRECLSGSSADCSKLGPDYSCFANTPCNDKDTYYCGASWSHAASNCLFPCPSGDDSDCPDQTSCFPFTTCNQNRTFMCGTSFDHASTCVHPCPSGSSSECPFGESCFTHTTCEVINEQDPTASSDLPYLSESSFYCGASFIEAATQCTEPCPSGLNSDCPYGQECFANTPCLNRETYFCGTSLEEASVSCEHPCPTVSISQLIFLLLHACCVWLIISYLTRDNLTSVWGICRVLLSLHVPLKVPTFVVLTSLMPVQRVTSHVKVGSPVIVLMAWVVLLSLHVKLMWI